MAAIDDFKAAMKALFQSMPATAQAAAYGQCDNIAAYVAAVGGGGGAMPGEILNNVTLNPWVDNVVPHTLGQAYEGIVVVRPRSVICDLWAHTGGVHSTAPGALVRLPLNTIGYDRGSNWDTSLYQMVAPVDGDYLVDGLVYWLDLSTGYYVQPGYYVGSTNQGAANNVCYGATTLRLKFGEYRQPMSQGDILYSYSYHANLSGAATNKDVGGEIRVSLIDDGVVESPTVNPSPSTQLILRTSYKRTVDLWVF